MGIIRHYYVLQAYALRRQRQIFFVICVATEFKAHIHTSYWIPAVFNNNKNVDAEQNPVSKLNAYLMCRWLIFKWISIFKIVVRYPKKYHDFIYIYILRLSYRWEFSYLKFKYIQENMAPYHDEININMLSRISTIKFDLNFNINVESYNDSLN